MDIRVVEIEECEQCQHYVLECGLCAMLDRIITEIGVPDDCPLPTPEEYRERTGA